MTATCSTCALWCTTEGTPYCSVKPLYSFTAPDHRCDEEVFGTSQLYHSPTSQKPMTTRNILSLRNPHPRNSPNYEDFEAFRADLLDDARAEEEYLNQQNR